MDGWVRSERVGLEAAEEVVVVHSLKQASWQVSNWLIRVGD